ncbi:response regulator [candidate division WWE3 bacterium]|uniref:Response regulator n=1 Tax=candidate division WWE3 bacterium TaxID=2053526 RepID=A0A955LKE7_UNCKA|nr:response regulator [candidate division WWE3 bacterium]
MADTKKAKILIVEDETFLRELYEELLADEGYEVLTAVDGADALEKSENDSFDLTLLDIMLPKKDGFSVMQELEESGKLQNLGKVVMLTNLGQDALVKRGFDMGAVGYLIKSAYTPDQILSEVAKFVS